MKRFAGWLLVVLVVATLRPGRAWADRGAPTDDERARAAALKSKGDDAMVSLRYADALDAYTAAYALLDDPALLYNQGRAYQMLGRFPEALQELEAFDAQAPAELKARVTGLGGLIADVRGRVSTLTITCNLRGARVLVRDKVVGTTPLPAPLVLNAGRAAVVVEAEGQSSFTKDVDLPGGGSLTVDAKLSSKATTGVLIVASPTTGAQVAIDGRVAGTVPVEVVVPAGPHRVVLRREGFVELDTSAVVAAGERKEVRLPLEPVRPITARWWFWAGIGAVVAGGAVVTAAMLTEGAAPKGDIKPGQASAPIRSAGFSF